MSWEKEFKSNEILVNYAVYNSIEENDVVDIYFRKGLFNVPWYVVINH